MMRNWLVSLWLVAGLAIAQPTVRLAFVGDISLDDGPGKTIAP